MATRFTEEEKIAALTTLANNRGNVQKASEETGISKNTLSTWAYKRDQAMYQGIRKKLAAGLIQQEIEKNLEVAGEARSAALLGVQKTHELLESNALDAREVPKATRDMGVTSAVFTDKALKHMEGVADQSAAGRMPKEIITALAAKGIKVDISIGPPGATEKPEKAVEGTAQEITPTNLKEN